MSVCVDLFCVWVAVAFAGWLLCLFIILLIVFCGFSCLVVCLLVCLVTVVYCLLFGINLFLYLRFVVMLFGLVLLLGLVI